MLLQTIVLLTMTQPTVALQPALLAWQRALAGAGAYCTATVVTSPMDVVKTRAQAAKGTQSSSLLVATQMLRKEGMLAFFAGLTPALLMAPAAMVQYTLIDPLRAQLPLYAAALIAGALDITIKCPFDRLKTQMQTNREGTMMSLLLSTVKASGIRGLWAGYAATLVRDLPYLVIKWVVYFQVQLVLQLGPLALIAVEARNLVAGAIAGGVAATAVTPADVIKTRLQVASASGAPAPSSLAIARSVVAEEGVLGLFRGIGPRLTRIPFYTAVTLATFDGIKSYFIHMQSASTGIVAAAAAVATKSEL